MVDPLKGRQMTAIRTDQSRFYTKSLSEWIKYKCKIINTNRIEMDIYAQQGGLGHAVFSRSITQGPTGGKYCRPNHLKVELLTHVGWS